MGGAAGQGGTTGGQASLAGMAGANGGRAATMAGGGGMPAVGGGAGTGAGGISAAGGAAGLNAGGSGVGPPAADGFAVDTHLASEIKSTAPTTVAIVRWSLDEPSLTEAHIDFGLDDHYGMTAPVDLGAVDYRTVLFGMKPAKTYHYRIVATDGAKTFTSVDRTLATGAPTSIFPSLTVSVPSPDLADRGFVIGSTWNGATSWSVFIIDTDGEVVWWYTDTANSGSSNDGIGRARLSADSHDVWLTTGQQPNPLRRVSIDTLDVEVYPDAKGTHDICAVGGETMAYVASTGTSCASVVEIDKSGTSKLVFDSTPVAGKACHGNAIRYSKKKDLYVFSDRDTDVYVLDRAGNLQWKLSDKVSGGHTSWGGVQHGVELLDASLLVFANEPTGDWSKSQVFEFGLDGSIRRKFASQGGTDWFGDVQRLPSGNTLVNYSLSGGIQEVDANDEVLLQISGWGYLGYTEFRQNLYAPPLDVESPP